MGLDGGLIGLVMGYWASFSGFRSMPAGTGDWGLWILGGDLCLSFSLSLSLVGLIDHD